MPGKRHPSTSPWAHPRVRHVASLWKQYCACDGFVQLDRWLADALRKNRSYGKRDRRIYSDALFSLARHSAAALMLESAFRAGCGRGEVVDTWRNSWPDSEAEWKRTLAVADTGALFCWTGILSGDKRQDSESCAARLNWWSEIQTGQAPLQFHLCMAGIPPWCESSLAERSRRSGWDNRLLQTFLQALHRRPPVWLRILNEDGSEKVIQELEDRGFSPRRIGRSVSVSGSANIASTEALRSGQVEIQDLASQMIVDTVGAVKGERVWDACSGGGGKALGIAAGAGPDGTVYASDIREHKIRQLRDRARRAGLANIRTFAADATTLLDLPEEVRQRGGFDRVLVDAPCSATGTWRRSPDARWRLNSRGLAGFVEIQRRLLDSCACTVRDRGALVYATCSWLPEENEMQIARFLADNPGWLCASMAMNGSPCHDADTMFAAVLIRTV